MEERVHKGTRPDFYKGTRKERDYKNQRSPSFRVPFLYSKLQNKKILRLLPKMRIIHRKYSFEIKINNPTEELL